MKAAKRKRRKVQPALLQAAVKLFGLRSFHGVTTRALAREAGVHDALIYVWFESKRKLYEQAVELARNEIMAACGRFMLDLLGGDKPVSQDSLTAAILAFHAAIPRDRARLLLQAVLSDDDPGDLARRTLDEIEHALANILDPRPRLNKKFRPLAATKLLIRALFWGKADDQALEQSEEILGQWMVGVTSSVEMT